MLPRISCVRGMNNLSATNFTLFADIESLRANSATILKSFSGISYEEINNGCF